MSDLEQRLDWTRKYHAFGWSLIPVSKNKLPAVSWKIAQEEKAPLSELLEYVKKGFGLAVATGTISGICVVDDDNPKKAPFDRHDFGITSLISSKTQNGGMHYYFEDWGARNKGQVKNEKGEYINIELRANGGYALLPPFFGYEWVTEPTQELLQLLPGRQAVPEELLKCFEDITTGDKQSFKDLVFDAVNADSFRDPILFELSRRSWINHFQGFEGYSPAHIKEFVHALNARFNPPKPPQVVEKAIEQGFEYAHRWAIEKNLISGDNKNSKPSSLLAMVEEQSLQLNGDRFFSGYEELDKATGGFEYHNTYAIAGLDKSGKSSFLMKMLQNKLEEGVRICYVNTEMPALEFAMKMATYKHNCTLKSVTPEMAIEWSREYSDQFEYVGVENMVTIKELEKAIEEKTKNVSAVVFDNITSWGNKAGGSEESWQVIAGVMDKLLSITKKKKIVTFAVMHTKQSGVVALKNMRGVLAQIEEGNYDSIFEESKSVVARPTLSDVYGGGGMLSQISGALLIWRPFQKIADPKAQMQSRVIIESFRYAPAGEVPFYFHGEMGLFSSSIIAPIKGSL